MADEAKLQSPMISTFEALVGHCHGEKSGLFCLSIQVLQFSVHPTDLLSILFRCHSFAGIRKAIKKWAKELSFSGVSFMSNHYPSLVVV